MYCPTCGQQQISDETRFCSRCGFLLSDIADVVANKGISPYKTPSKLIKPDSPRKLGIKKGGMIMLVGCLLIVPVISILMPFLEFSPFVIPVAAVLSFMGGLLRIIYAFMFESNDNSMTPFEGKFIESIQEETIQKISGNKTKQNVLHSAQSIPTSVYSPPQQVSWMDTNDLVQPPSVTDNTTKLLQKEE
jgi:hypothetical protein